MAPIDRREHRQQRVRGAGPSAVQASFGFNFGALGARPAKKASLPPQLSSRQTPVRSTPHRANGSTQRNRSASIQRSSTSKRRGTPKDHTITPQLGKRKRGSTTAQVGALDEEEDELSPGREELVRSIEKSRRVIGAVSTIHEELDDVPDELSILDHEESSVRKTMLHAKSIVNGTPVSMLAQKRISSGGIATRTPIADRVGSISVTSRHFIPSASKSVEPGLATPNLLRNGQSGLSSASHFSPQFNTPSAVQVDDESEDELSPIDINGTTPRIVRSEQQPNSNLGDDDHMEVDELSSSVQPAQELLSIRKVRQASKDRSGRQEEELAEEKPAKRGRPRRIVLDEGDEVLSAPISTETDEHGRPAKNAEVKLAATPTARKPRQQKGAELRLEEDDQLDELSPDKDRSVVTSKQPAGRTKEVVNISDEEDSDYEEPGIEDAPLPTPPPAAKLRSPKRIQNLKTSAGKPPRKRHKFLGPKHAISVMRIKGSTVRGITVADTTRTILEETLDYRLTRIAEKLQTSTDSTRRKELRGELNMSLSFKESLNEKLMDLQDANDVLSTNFKKMKLFKRDNTGLRKDILTLQNSREEIALEHDGIQAEYNAMKTKVDSRNKLSEDMFEIENAIHNGRRKARKEGREAEGPKVPLSMVLGMVGRDVGSFGGGLLKNVQSFSGVLERAAGWLEGRA
ncbi:hypothetical protein GQ44DRAFT_684206 [Phaeosphaeriaceae sp. PMI808]|nr:hypothetical protein GQ44DRAFT_684206 [Phaeosphaeriaceae sp. PMI808]